jgi:hypothetical protein
MNLTKQQLEEELARQKAINDKYAAQKQHQADYHKKYAIDHPDKIKASHAKWNAAHAGEALTPEQQEKQRTYHQNYNKEHKVENRLYHQNYRANKIAKEEANKARIAELEAQLNQ